MPHESAVDIALQADLPNEAQLIKRRAACDECRTKKLKCTGEQPACSRCVREHITCVYSPQKQMGRPKKRTRTDDEVANGDLVQQNAPAWGSNGMGTDGALQLGAFDTAFTPGGGLQPWLQHSGEWPDIPGEGGVPGLTPDSSSGSPPMLNLPPELQMTHRHGHNNTNPHAQQDSTSLLLDPAPLGLNFGCPPGPSPNCACLSSLYLTFNSLQGMDPKFTFPFALHPLREAMQTATAVLACEECPTRFISAIQNVQLVGTLLMSIAERFGKVLEHITVESIRAELAGEKKKFRLADLNTSTSHLHAGGLGCAAAFSLNLSPEEWRSMCKKVVRAEVHGPEDGNECCPYLMGILKQMTERQHRWHKSPYPDDSPRDADGNSIFGPRHSHKQEDHLCLKLIGIADKMVQSFDWT